jgi:tetratricopeptide (TPR) repeat protein
VDAEAVALAPPDTRREFSFDGRGGVASVWPERVLPVGSVLCGGRFEVLQRIGQGGMAAVYEVLDAEREQRVALKALSQSDASSVRQFQSEFRVLSSIHHPGLVRLYELFQEDDFWFFTMERVDGQRFDQWARPGGQLDVRRLRRGLRQLVSALNAIHTANQLHRDVKASNVLVSTAERVVVLDLGLVAELGKSNPEPSSSGLVLAGTPEYMAPEQAFGSPVTSASDFYGVGVILFEALTGRLPFTGQLGEILAAKQREPDLLRLLRGAEPPADLAELCLALLSREPTRRPTAAAMLDGRWLRDESRPSAPAPSAPKPFSALLGRSAELSLLWAAHRDAQEGQAVLVVVSGESGIGKSELCRSFLDQVRAEQLATVLVGRCHERTAVPFEALDSLARELGRHLRALPRAAAAELLPRQGAALGQLFPALAPLDAAADAPERPLMNACEIQRRACAGLSELLGRVRDRRPLIVHIDDAHWMDADSAAILRQVLVDRELRPLLLVLCQGAESAGQSRAFEPLLAAARSNPALSVRQLAVEPLPEADAEALALELLSREGPPDVARCRSIALESRGSPFFVHELVRLGRASGAASDHPSVSEVIAERVQGLSPTGRRLLEATALVGQPLNVEVVLEATAAAHADVEALCAAHLLSQSEADGQRLIECHHDRIRAAIADGMALDVTRAHYRGLAAALSRNRGVPPELISRSWEGAGERAEAARYAVVAAERASRITAFEHAAALYRRALDLGPASCSGSETVLDEIELPRRLAAALEHAGRGAEAAAMYRQVAELCSGDASLEQLRRAAEQLLLTGHFEEGSELLASLCGALDVYFPTGSPSALSQAWTKLRLELCDLDAPPPLGGVSTRDALRVRTAQNVITGLIGYLPAHAVSVAGRYLLMALDVGDESERVRGIGLAAYLHCHIDPASRRSRELCLQLMPLAKKTGKDELIGFAHLIRGVNAVHRQRCREGRRLLDRAVLELRACPGTSWELDLASVYDQLAASHNGDYADIVRSTPGLVDEALRRGRVWTAAMLSGVAGLPAWNIEGPAAYRRQLADITRHWQPRLPPVWPDYQLLMGEALICLYEGQPERGVALLEERRERFCSQRPNPGAGEGSGGFARLMGRCAAAALEASAAGSTERDRWITTLRLAIATLEKQGGLAPRALATLYEGALESQLGETDNSLALLRGALACFDHAGMGMFAAAARRRLGQLVGGDEGRALVERGEDFMHAEGVDDLDTETLAHCPGYAEG